MMELNFVKSQSLFSHCTLCFKELLSRVLSSAMIELNCDSLKHLHNEVKNWRPELALARALVHVHSLGVVS